MRFSCFGFVDRSSLGAGWASRGVSITAEAFRGLTKCVDDGG